jgi:hypothetical protein
MSTASSTLPAPARVPGSAARFALAYKLTVSVAILLSIVLISGIYRVGSNTLLAGGFLGAVFIYLVSRPSLIQLGLSLLASAFVATLYGILGGTFGQDSGIETLSLFMGIGAFLGAGSILVMALDKVWTGSSQYTALLTDALILPVFTIVAGLAMQFANGGPHLSFDFLLYRFDTSLGLAPGASVTSVFRKLPWVRTGSIFAYAGLLVFPPLYHAWASYRGKAAKIHLLHAFAIAGVAGSLLYQICPAVGLIVTFGQQFPDRLPALAAVPTQAFMSASVHNAMPSMHMTWALLIWVAAWELGWFAVAIASGFVVFTGFATVGFGEHYLIDLIVAVPLVMMIRGVCASRHKLTVVGLAMVVAWTVYLRTGIQVPAPLNGLLVIATVATPAYFFIVRRWATRLS